MANEGGKIEGKIYLLLSEGYNLSAIAKKVGKSPAAILKRARKYEREGKLERVVKYPALYQIPKEILPPHNARHQILPPPPKTILIPHRFAATLAIVGTPNIRRKKAWATIKTEEYTLQIGRSKARLALKFTQGETPEQRIYYGQRRIKELANELGARYGCTFTVLRFDPQIEWTLNDEPASRELSQKVGIKRDEPQEIADAMFRFDDPSHPRLIEINKAKGKPPHIPTEHAKSLYYLLTQAPTDIKRLIELEKERDKTLARLMDAVVALNQKIEMQKR